MVIAASNAAHPATNVNAQVPEIQVRELDTLYNANSGEIVVIGGLMRDEAKAKKSGIPGMQEIPILGHAFSGKDDSHNMIELVFIIKATILESDYAPVVRTSTLNDYDVHVYETLIQDPAPMDMRG